MDPEDNYHLWRRPETIEKQKRGLGCSDQEPDREGTEGTFARSEEMGSTSERGP